MQVEVLKEGITLDPVWNVEILELYIHELGESGKPTLPVFYFKEVSDIPKTATIMIFISFRFRYAGKIVQCY